MGWLDWALLAMLSLSVLLGFWRGLVHEVIAVAGWVAAFLLAQAYAAEVAAGLPLADLALPLQVAIGFVLIFIAVAFAGGLLVWMVKRLFAVVGLRPVDRVLGGAFGALRGLLFMLGLTLVVHLTPLRTQPWWQDSLLAQPLSSALLALQPLLPESLTRHLS
ncbi:MAG: CvpA family protein [Hydrogenophaga sp.]|nr:CvpA family protein [Hydrogenophaga sp.]